MDRAAARNQTTNDSPDVSKIPHFLSRGSTSYEMTEDQIQQDRIHAPFHASNTNNAEQAAFIPPGPATGTGRMCNTTVLPADPSLDQQQRDLRRENVGLQQGEGRNKL
jgi:hypothetical protein